VNEINPGSVDELLSDVMSRGIQLRHRRRRTRAILAGSLSVCVVAIGSWLVLPGLVNQQGTRIQVGGPNIPYNPPLPTCPSTRPDKVTTTAEDASTRLVPLTAGQARVCLYGGFNDSPRLGLVESANVTDSVHAAALADALNALPAQPAGNYFCPSDDHRTVLAMFSGEGQTIDVSIGLTGCQLVTNGMRVSWAAKSRAVLAQFITASGADPAKWLAPTG
jgi:hypothetical protein